MPETVMIDLGDARDLPEIVSRPRVAGRYRAPVTALVVLATLVGLGGAAAPPDGLVETRVPGGLGDSIDVQDDRLYVIRPHRNQPLPDGDRTITAYGLPGGERLWQSRVRERGGRAGGLMAVGDAVLLVRYDDGSADADEVVALDGGTGARRWRRSGTLVGWATADAGGRLLLGSGSSGRGFAEPETITGVDPRTGEPAWTYRPPRGALVMTAWGAYGTGATAIVTGLPSGRVEVRDIATGLLRVAADVRPPVGPIAADRRPQWLAVLGDLILVTDPGSETVTAYGLGKLDRRWAIPWEGGVGWYGSPACGELLCLQSEDGRLRALDPRTGQERWQQDWAYLEPVGSALLASRGRGPSGGEAPLVLVDPATGGAVAELGAWAIAGERTGPGEVVLVQHDALSRRAWLGLLEPGAAEVRLLGVATEVIGDCQGGRDSVVCRKRDSAIGIIRYR